MRTIDTCQRGTGSGKAGLAFCLQEVRSAAFSAFAKHAGNRYYAARVAYNLVAEALRKWPQHELLPFEGVMASAEPLPEWLEIDLIGGVTVLRFRCPLVLQGQTAEIVADRLTRLVTEAKAPRLVINCQNVTMLSSLMLGKLVVLARKATRAGGRLAICNAHRSVTAVLIVSRLVESVSIYPDKIIALVLHDATR